MNRKQEITNDIWSIFREMYQIHSEKTQSDKQLELLTKIADYIDENLSTRKKRKEDKCSKE